MSSSHSAPTRTLPARPSLAQLRKQSKELLRAYRAGERSAASEVERFERAPEPSTFALADAQRVLARAYGFPSWTRLKEHIDGVTVEALCAAVESGNVATVRKVAKARPDLINSERGNGFGESMALHFAVLKRDAEMTRVLMELGADARSGIWPHRDATTAHTIATDRGYAEIVAIIEQAEERRRREMSTPGATVGTKTDEIQRAILEGRSADAIVMLQADLSLVGSCNVRGETPLHVAAWMHDPPTIEWLLRHGAAPNAKDAGLKTPLDYAAFVAGSSSHGRHFSLVEGADRDPALFEETVRLLRAGSADLTPRAAVAIGDQHAVLQMHREGRLANEIHTIRGGLLSIAVRVNRSEMVSLLLDLGLDPDETVLGEDGRRTSWGMPLWFTAMCGRHEIAELLLRRGADIDGIVYASGDAMSIAGSTGDDAMKALLRRHGARITVEGIAGAGDHALVKAVLEGAVKAQSLNVENPTLTDLAEQMLWAAGGSDATVVRMCLPHITRGPRDPWWSYVLMHATLPESFKAVLDHGVDPDVVAEGGYTLLHHLATRFVDETTRVLRATMLLDAGASVQKRDPILKSTPLGWACRWGHLDLVKLYLERGTDSHESDSEPWATPLAWAMKYGHGEIAELLRESAH